MRFVLTKREILATAGCVLVLLMTVGAVGRRGKQHSRLYICQKKLRIIERAQAAYWEERGGLILMEYGENNWTQVIDCYAGEREGILLCPEVESYSGSSTCYGTATETWCFNFGFEEPTYGSYGINGWLLEDVYGWFGGDERFYENPYSIEKPALTPTFADSFWLESWSMDVDEMAKSLAELREPSALPHAEGYFMKRFCVDRHELAVNVVFADGHVERIGIVDLWTLQWNRNFEPRYDMELPEN